MLAPNLHFDPDRDPSRTYGRDGARDRIIYETDDFAITQYSTSYNNRSYLWRNHEEVAMCFDPLKSHGTYENWYRKVRKRVERRIEKIASQLSDLIDERNKLQTWLDG